MVNILDIGCIYPEELDSLGAILELEIGVARCDKTCVEKVPFLTFFFGLTCSEEEVWPDGN